MRSMGGGFDNEATAVTARMMTFYFWLKSLESDRGWTWALVAAFAYYYMVANWGGYVFVLNMIGFHVAFMILCDQYSTNLFYAYTLFYPVATICACSVPVVQ